MNEILLHWTKELLSSQMPQDRKFAESKFLKSGGTVENLDNLREFRKQLENF